MSTTYRQAAHETTGTKTPTTLACHLLSAGAPSGTRMVIAKGGLTVGACAMANAGGGAAWALAVLALGGLWLGRDLRRRKVPDALFHVESGRLRVQRPGATDLRLSLAQLHEVRLDTRSSFRDLTVSRSDGVNAAFGMSRAHSIEFDVSRIELVTHDDQVLLTRDYTSHSPCLDQMRDIRRFLRAHGWLPLDEREATPAPRRKRS